MDEHYYAVIMAGGGGTRLWPLSRKGQPKQMLRLGGERTLFQRAVDRLEGVIPPERTLVVTVAEQAAQLRKQYPQIPSKNFILEPMPRGTASVVGLAAVAIRNRDNDPNTTMAVLTADHFIRNVPYFRNLLEAAHELALDGYMVTLGIEPTSASTAYGYIKRGEWIGGFKGLNGYKVIKFTEKPSKTRAETMIRMGGHSWNSGMFIWRTEQLMTKVRQFLPDLAVKLEKIDRVWDSLERSEVLEEVWPTIQKETIDYGIMERAEEVAVIPAEKLGWYDVGSWDSLFDVFTPDEDGNVVLDANHINFDGKNSLVVGEKARKPIVTLGTRNLIIVETDQALLVCPKEDAQRVRELIDYLKNSGREDLL